VEEGVSSFQSERASPVPQSGPSRSETEVLWNAAMLASMVLEATIVAPTLYAEYMIVGPMGSLSLLLRVIISLFRLMPAIVTVARCCRRRLACLVWSLCQRPESEGSQTSFLERIAMAATYSQDGFKLLLFPEVHWGLAITVDMWYLLITPLEYQQVSTSVLVIANIILCCMDLVTLILSLAFKAVEESSEQQRVNRANFHQPKPVVIKRGDAVEGVDAPTCTICLCDFEEVDDAVQLPCSHVFHRECVGRWLQRSFHCPMRCPHLVSPPESQAQFESVQGPSSDPHRDQVAAFSYGRAFEHRREEFFIAVLPGEAHDA